MRKLLKILLLATSFLFADIDLNSASKNELMMIKGIGSKKADAIIAYRKSHKISSANDLKNIKGIGPGIIKNLQVNKTVSK